MRSGLPWLLLLAAVSVDCGARTFKVFDTSTDLPIVGAEAELIARGNVLGITHAEVTLREWHVKTDANGEFSISPPFAERAFLLSLWKRGYARTSSVKEYKLRHSGNANQDVYYLTPAAEANAEYVRYLFYVAAEAMDTGKGLAGGPAIVGAPHSLQASEEQGEDRTGARGAEGFLQVRRRREGASRRGGACHGDRSEFDVSAGTRRRL